MSMFRLSTAGVMSVVVMSVVVMSVLLAVPVQAQEAEEPAEEPAEESPAEGPGEGDAEEPAEPEASPEAAPADAPVVVPAGEPVVVPAGEPEAAKVEAPAPAEEAETGEEARAPSAMGVAYATNQGPWFSIQIGGGGTQILDPGWTMLGLVVRRGQESGQGALDRFHFGVDVYPHPNVAVSVAIAHTEDRGHLVTTDTDGSLTFTTSSSGMDVGGKVILAPPFLPLRPYVRGGGGFFQVTTKLTAAQGNGNLASREYSGLAPYGMVGGGIEITSPRQLPPGARKGKKSTGKDRLRWGAGFFIEGGVTLGGGGTEVVAAPTVDLGDLGDLSMGPGYLRMGMVLLF